MKPLITCLIFAVLAVTAPAVELKSVPPEKFRAAGLHKLTESELAELQILIDQLKSGEVAAIKQEAEQKVAVAEAKVKETEAKAKEAEAEQKKSGPGWLGALITLKRAESKSKVEVSDLLVSRVEGTFKTFSGRRSFTLENGQVWTMVENDSYAGPTYTNPEVEIYPGIMGSFWLRVPAAAVRFKVKPVKLD
jgi:hypothetical protein